MIELIFMACLAGRPNDCNEQAFQYANITTMNCIMGAQQELAKWANLNPDWTITTWKCQHVELREVRA